jgi:amino acid transporter
MKGELIPRTKANYWRIHHMMWKRRVFTWKVIMSSVIATFILYGGFVYLLFSDWRFAVIVSTFVFVLFLSLMPLVVVWYTYYLTKKNPELGFRKALWLHDFE